MIEYTIKRLFTGIFVIFAVTALLFAIMQLMPGDAIQLIANPRVSPERIEELREAWGLNKPAYVQYFYWLSHVLKGDLGTSISTGQQVSVLIKARFPYTMLLTGLSLILQYIIAVPLGLITASNKNTRADGIMVVLTIILWSMPPFWLGILLMLVFGIWLKVLPISGYSGLSSLILPLMTMTLPSLASVFRLARSEVLEVLREKYVLTAYAKGLNRKRVLTFHVLRNALIPVTVMFFLSLPWLIGGSVIVESVFAWPGMGGLLWKAISNQDYPVVQGIIFIIAILTVISNILGDILSAFLDPRIRLEIKGDNL
ncbi:MAG TPA: ABC transporter permease [Thermoanaerobacterales bacterium]|jgi:ABC-type dipeptide/oligopeptide/nickel transport system permease component|nr:ABC transporter permease [Thermoanaerobacterales bacterium]